MNWQEIEDQLFRVLERLKKALNGDKLHGSESYR